MHYHLIVHREDVILQMKDINISDKKRELAKEVNKIIEKLINKKLSNVLEISKGQDPRKIPKHIKSNDFVTLYGGRHGQCLSSTLLALQLKNINADYHPKGYI